MEDQKSNKLMRKPDFFIVGAPKCGTTAMYDYLGQHPAVFISPLKEFHHFGSDLILPGKEIDNQTYLSLFTSASEGQVVGDASGWYLFSVRAAAEISAFNPAAKIIIMLRNPVDMIYSLHAQRLYSGTEDIEDFQQAIEAEGARRLGQRRPTHSWITRGLFYLDVAKYAEQVKRYLDVFGAEKTRIIIFDDFEKDPRQSYRQTCTFLAIDSAFEPRFRVVNANKKPRSKFVRDLLDREPPAALKRLGRVVPKPTRQRLYQSMRSLNSDNRPRPPMDLKLRRRLQEHFILDVERLSQLLGRDLTDWCK